MKIEELDLCAFRAGMLQGFADLDRCPDADREWIRAAGLQMAELVQLVVDSKLVTQTMTEER